VITEEEEVKKGDLVKLYNLYEAHIENPAVIGVYLGTHQEGQFISYEIAVVKESLLGMTPRQGGFVDRYLASDFILCRASTGEGKGEKRNG